MPEEKLSQNKELGRIVMDEATFRVAYERWLDMLRSESSTGLPVADSDHQRLLQEVRRS